MASEISRTARRCDPLAAYLDAVAGYAETIGATTLFIATDSDQVLADAAALAPRFRTLYMRNVTRTRAGAPPPKTILDEVIKARARSGRGVASTEHDALQGALDAMLLARCDVLVGKFTSGLFRAAYALASARRGGGYPPFASLDAPWCADYGVPAGYNDAFPDRAPAKGLHDGLYGAGPTENVVTGDGETRVRRGGANSFLC